MVKTREGEIEGKLESVTRIQLKMGLEDVELRIGGNSFYIRSWRLDNEKQHTRIQDLLSLEEYDRKEEFLEIAKQHIGERVKIKFKIRAPYIDFALDRLFGSKLPRTCKEIVRVDYLETKPPLFYDNIS